MNKASTEIITSEGLSIASSKALINLADEISKVDGIDIDPTTAKYKAAVMSKYLKGMGLSTASANPTNKKGALNIAILIGFIGADKMNNMEVLNDPSNCGTNKMCLYVNSWPFGKGAEVKSEVLDDNTNDVFIELKGSDSDGPFYLASPCKTDLSIKPGKCTCAEYHSNTVIDGEVIMQKWLLQQPDDINDRVMCYYNSDLTGVSIQYYCEPPVISDTFRIPVHFSEGNTCERLDIGKPVTFDYTPEGEGTETQSVTIKDGEYIRDPKMLEDMLIGMEKEDLNKWVKRKTYGPNQEFIDEDDLEIMTFKFGGMIIQNAEQGTTYKSCIKGGVWAYLTGKNEEYPCLIVEGTDYPGERPNFCYEKKWDKAGYLEAGFATAEVVGGIAAALVAAPETAGAGSWPAYCMVSTGISTASAWMLAGVEAEDKWPHGLQD